MVNDLARLTISNLTGDKCELCSRRGETTQLKFDGNTFDVCEICRSYLESPFEEIFTDEK